MNEYKVRLWVDLSIKATDAPAAKTIADFVRLKIVSHTDVVEIYEIQTEKVFKENSEYL